MIVSQSIWLRVISCAAKDKCRVKRDHAVQYLVCVLKINPHSCLS